MFINRRKAMRHIVNQALHGRDPLCRTPIRVGILDAMKEERLLKDVKETLQVLYKHYHYSSKALRELREVAEALELAVLKPVNVMSWVPDGFLTSPELLKLFCET